MFWTSVTVKDCARAGASKIKKHARKLTVLSTHLSIMMLKNMTNACREVKT